MTITAAAPSVVVAPAGSGGPVACGIGTVWNTSTTLCMPAAPSGASACGRDTVWNATMSVCEPLSLSGAYACGHDTVWNATTSLCEPSALSGAAACGSNTAWNATAELCVPVFPSGTSACGLDTAWNATTLLCDAGASAMSCGNATQWDPVAGQCAGVATAAACGGTTVWDNGAGRCVDRAAQLACGVGTAWNSGTSQCEAPLLHQACGDGVAWDAASQQCVVQCEGCDVQDALIADLQVQLARSQSELEAAAEQVAMLEEVQALILEQILTEQQEQQDLLQEADSKPFCNDCVRIGLALPLCDSAFSSTVAAVEAAFTELNDKADGVYDDLLPGNTTLALAVRDTQGTAAQAFLSAAELMGAFGGFGAQALIGCGLSASSVSSSTVSDFFQVPLVGPSPLSASATLGDREFFPFFLRTAPSDAAQLGALISVTHHVLNFTRATLLFKSPSCP